MTDNPPPLRSITYLDWQLLGFHFSDFKISSQHKSGTEEPKLLALVERSEKLRRGWNEMVNMEILDPAFIDADLIEPDRQEEYVLNAGLTGVVIDKDMIKNVSGKNVHNRRFLVVVLPVSMKTPSNESDILTKTRYFTIQFSRIILSRKSVGQNHQIIFCGI